MTITRIQIARLKAVIGQQVTITRGEQSCQVKVVPSQSKAKLVGTDGSYREVIVEDWIVLIDEWTLTGPLHPLKGDRITTNNETWVISHPDDKTPVFENFNPCDRPAIAWTIHSVKR